LLTKTNRWPIIGRCQQSADADCQMADTDYQPIIGAPLIIILLFHTLQTGNRSIWTVILANNGNHQPTEKSYTEIDS